MSRTLKDRPYDIRRDEYNPRKPWIRSSNGRIAFVEEPGVLEKSAGLRSHRTGITPNRHGGIGSSRLDRAENSAWEKSAVKTPIESLVDLDTPDNSSKKGMGLLVMRYFSRNVYDPESALADSKGGYVETISEAELRRTYYQWSRYQMIQKIGQEAFETNWSFEDCLNDWLAVHWGWETRF